MRRPPARAALAVFLLAASMGAAAPGSALAPAAAVGASWPSAGHDLSGSRDNPDETQLTTQTIGQLGVAWSATFPGALTSTPAVANGVVYLPDNAGNLTALRATTGAPVWSHPVSDWTGHAGDVDHATPAVSAGRLVFGVRPGPDSAGASVLAVRAGAGTLLWKTVVDPNPVARITGGAVIDGDTAYIGVSSGDEATDPCGCTFRGSLVALDVRTGAIKWQTRTVPVGYTGGAIFAGSPVVDHDAGLVYAGTGNNYSVPPGVCGAPGQKNCTAPSADDHFDSLLAFDTTTGAIVWAMKAPRKADASTIACRNTPTCGPDYGYASSPNLFRTTVNGRTVKLVGIGEKSGLYSAVNRTTGRLVWRTQVGPGGAGGGIQWGTATDGTRIYAAVTNSTGAPYQLISGQTTTGGAFSALDPATGRLLWQVADPQDVGDFGYLSVAGGVVYAGSSAVAGSNMYALDAATGTILRGFASGGSVMGGAAIVDGMVFWPAGYYTMSCPDGQTWCPQSYTLWAFARQSSATGSPATVSAASSGRERFTTTSAIGPSS